MIFFIFILYFIFTIAENHWIKNWSPNYFRYGIPIYRKQVNLLSLSADIKDYKQKLGRNVSKYSKGSDIDYYILSTREMGFRVKYKTHNKGRNRQSYNHAILKLNRNRITFTGYLSLTTVVFILLMLGMFASLRLPLSTTPGSLIFPAFIMLIFSFNSIRGIRDYGRINNAIQHTFQDQIGLPQQSLSELHYPDPNLDTTEYKMPDIQTYDPFTTKSSDSSNTIRIIAIGVLVGLLLFIGIASVLFWVTYAG